MHEQSLYSSLVRAGARGESAVLATVVDASGSTPRRAGTQMVIEAESLAGTIGGGALEARVVERARSILLGAAGETAPVLVESIDLHGDPDEPRDGICGGLMVIHLLRVSSDEQFGVANAVVQMLATGQSVMVTCDAIGTLSSCVPSPAGRTTQHGAAEGPSADDGWSLVINPPPVVYIAGAGHCGVALALAATPLGFDVWLEDDRPDARAGAEDVLPLSPGLVSVTPGPSAHTLSDPRIAGRDVFACLVTRSFRQDLASLQALRDAKAINGAPIIRYIGLMGSRRRLGTVMNLLRDAGWSNDELATIDAPIGLDIGAQSPAEIAISICATLIQERSAQFTRC